MEAKPRWSNQMKGTHTDICTGGKKDNRRRLGFALPCFALLWPMPRGLVCVALVLGPWSWLLDSGKAGGNRPVIGICIELLFIAPRLLVFGRVKIEKLSATTLRVELIDLLSWGPNPNCSFHLYLYLVMRSIFAVVPWQYSPYVFYFLIFSVWLIFLNSHISINNEINIFMQWLFYFPITILACVWNPRNLWNGMGVRHAGPLHVNRC